MVPKLSGRCRQSTVRTQLLQVQTVDSLAASELSSQLAKRVSIGTELPGIVTAVTVKAGDRVSKGDPLFQLDNRTSQANVAIARANLLAAEAKLRELESEIPPTQAKVAAAEAQLETSERGRSKCQVATRTRPAVAEIIGHFPRGVGLEAIGGSFQRSASVRSEIARAGSGRVARQDRWFRWRSYT